MNTTKSEEQHDESVGEMVSKAAQGKDEPMGRRTPQAPFALVALSYFTALALVVLFVAWIVFGVLGK